MPSHIKFSQPILLYAFTYNHVLFLGYPVVRLPGYPAVRLPGYSAATPFFFSILYKVGPKKFFPKIFCSKIWDL